MTKRRRRNKKHLKMMKEVTDGTILLDGLDLVKHQKKLTKKKLKQRLKLRQKRLNSKQKLRQKKLNLRQELKLKRRSLKLKLRLKRKRLPKSRQMKVMVGTIQSAGSLLHLKSQ